MRLWDPSESCFEAPFTVKHIQIPSPPGSIRPRDLNRGEVFLIPRATYQGERMSNPVTVPHGSPPFSNESRIERLEKRIELLEHDNQSLRQDAQTLSDRICELETAIEALREHHRT
jgi:hypothetical protein